MRAFVKVGEGWIQETPEDLSRWMWRHDGDTAVIIDDMPLTFYCGTEALCEEYRRGGKHGEMFFTLDRRLWEKERGI